MFKISPIQDPNVQKQYAELSGSPYREGAFAYAMYDASTLDPLGFSQFEIKEDGGWLLDLRPISAKDDYAAMFILGRQTMNFIDLCGTHILNANVDSADETLLRAIGLKPTENGKYYCDMTGFFDGSHCSGH